MAEGESDTFGRFSLDNAIVAKFTTQIYPHLYPQMIGLAGYLTVKNWSGQSHRMMGAMLCL